MALETDLDPDLHAGRLAQARRPVQRGGAEVLPVRRAGLGGDALRHVAGVRRRGRHRCSPRSPRSSPAAAETRRSSTSASSSPWWASPSRSRPCRSTSGRPTPTRARPTPVTAFLSVASKAGGFVAIFCSSTSASSAGPTSWRPILWVLAALSMTVGNLVAIRQTNIVRMLAYSSIAQARLHAGALRGGRRQRRQPIDAAFTATVVYLLIYAAMNLGAFAVVIAVARKTRSGEILATAGCSPTPRAWPSLMAVFLFSLAGIPPLGRVVRQVRDVPGRARRRQRAGRDPRRRRRRQLGDRALLLRRAWRG